MQPLLLPLETYLSFHKDGYSALSQRTRTSQISVKYPGTLNIKSVCNAENKLNYFFFPLLVALKNISLIIYVSC